jgi:hypothetical protein
LYSKSTDFTIRGKKKSAYHSTLFFLLDIETLLEAINTSASVNQLLLTGVERMALGADINLHLFLGRAGFECFTAYAANDAFAVLGMDVFLHCCFTSFAYAMALNAKSIISYRNGFCNIFFAIFRRLLYNDARGRLPIPLFSGFSAQFRLPVQSRLPEVSVL